jgi:SH3-like domain-containing protein
MRIIMNMKRETIIIAWRNNEEVYAPMRSEAETTANKVTSIMIITSIIVNATR